jgi:hypothetical protein
MDAPEFEIEIRPTGEVKVHVTGVSGRQCLSYADMLAEIIGQEKSREVTAEYDEQDRSVRIQAQQRRR